MSITIGSFTSASGMGNITTCTPVYEYDTTTTAGTTYFRYENTTASQFITRLQSGKYERTYGLWSGRAALATWQPINYSG
jgi:hypothetical protein